MAISKTKKHDIVQKVTEVLKDATSAVFVQFTGLSVADTAAMRKSLRQEGIGYYVAKKSLIRRAISESGYDVGEIPAFPGEIAIAWSTTDITAPARAIYEHGKKKKDTLTIVGGIFENALTGAEKMQTIATIPSMQVLRGMFVNVINSPIQGLVIALDQISATKA